MKHLSIRELLFALLGTGMIIAALYLFGGYYYLKMQTEKSIRMESLNRAFFVTKQMAGLYDRITDEYKEREDEMYGALREAQTYFKEKGRDASLDLLKRQLMKGRKETVYEIFHINDQYVIDRTTFPNDLGMDFKRWETAYRLLQSIFADPEAIDLSMIIHSASKVDMRRFIVQRAEDDDYLIQLGLTLDREYLQQQTIIELQQKVPTLVKNRVYQIFGSHRAPKDMERWWMMEVNSESDNTLKVQDDVPDELERLLAPMLQLPKAFIDRKERQKYLVELFEEKSYLDTYFWEGEQYIHRVVMPLSSRFSLYNESVSLIVMEFDESEAQQTVLMMNIMVGTLWVFLALFTFIAVWLVRSRIILPLSLMQKKIRENEGVSISKIPNKRDEVGSIARAYNQLLNDLHREIYSNKVLFEQFKIFAGNAIHQIRTPLSVIKIALEMAESQNREAEQQIEASLVSIEHMYDTLSYMVQHDKVEYPAEKIDLSALFEKRIAIFQVVAEANDIAFSVNIEPNLYVLMNPMEAEYLIDNNISNAIKFSRIDSVVSLSLKRSNDELILSFWNYGEAIHDVEAVFQRHIREDESRSGSGIGLNMVNTICKRNNILIQVDYVNRQNQFSYFIEAM